MVSVRAIHILLSLLEVKCLNGVGKNKGKKNSEARNHSCNYSKKVVMIAVVSFQEFFHTVIRILQHHILDVSKLGRKQSIQAPCNWTCPVKPSPPYRNPL